MATCLERREKTAASTASLLLLLAVDVGVVSEIGFSTSAVRSSSILVDLQHGQEALCMLLL